MRNHPIDSDIVYRLERGIRALHGIKDIMVSGAKHDTPDVDCSPDNFAALLGIITDEIEDAHKQLYAA